MQRPRLQWRPSLLEKFALVGVVPIVALGVVLGYYLKQKIEQRALANAREVAVLTSKVGLLPHLTAADLEHGLSAEKERALDEALANSSSGTRSRGSRSGTSTVGSSTRTRRTRSGGGSRRRTTSTRHSRER